MQTNYETVNDHNETKGIELYSYTQHTSHATAAMPEH